MAVGALDRGLGQSGGSSDTGSADLVNRAWDRPFIYALGRQLAEHGRKCAADYRASCAFWAASRECRGTQGMVVCHGSRLECQSNAVLLGREALGASAAFS